MHGDRRLEITFVELQDFQQYIAAKSGEEGHECQSRHQCLHHMTTVGMKNKSKPDFGVVTDHNRAWFLGLVLGGLVFVFPFSKIFDLNSFAKLILSRE